MRAKRELPRMAVMELRMRRRGGEMIGPEGEGGVEMMEFVRSRAKMR